MHNIRNDECDHHEPPVPGLKARLVEANGQVCGFDQQGNFDGSQDDRGDVAPSGCARGHE